MTHKKHLRRWYPDSEQTCGRPTQTRRRNPFITVALTIVMVFCLAPLTMADQIRMVDGSTIEVDEAWEDADGFWYKRGGVTQFIVKSRVKGIERALRGEGEQKNATNDVSVVKTAAQGPAQAATPIETIWIHLVGGAKMEVDEATEGPDGVWYKRGNLSIFIARTHVQKVERIRIDPEDLVASADGKRTKRERRWTTGSSRLDALIKQNGARYGVDPYLIFCVMEQESHFNSRAVSPMGARGLMQLMPGTAARFGVRNAHNPAQNVSAGTRYLKELLRRFNDRVDLVLAGYNAGEGAVMKYGRRVPPYRETRNYVRRISAKYQGGE
jgi:Zn-finger nucleic acid-binding protein